MICVAEGPQKGSTAMTLLSVARLEQLLRESEHEHGKFERHLGARDENWPLWYAQFLCDRIAETDGLAPVTLTGRFVELRPLRLEHLDELCAVGLDPSLWRHTVSQITTRAELEAYVRTALDEQA